MVCLLFWPLRYPSRPFPFENIVQVVILRVRHIPARRLVIRRPHIRQEIVNHIPAPVGFDIHRPGRNLARHRVLNIPEIEVSDTSRPVRTNHTSRLPFREEFVNPHPERGTVFEVIGYRRLASHLITEFHRPRTHLQVNFRQFVVYQRTEHMRLRHLPQLRMAMVVVGETYTGSSYLFGFES